MRALKHTYRLLIVGAVAACASSGANDGRPRYDANLITGEELSGRSDISDRSGLEAIQRLRPAWLRRTGFRNALPSVVMDNQPYQLDILETVRPEEIESLRFLSPSDATTRYGTGYTSGVIEVLTRQR